jgi:hypothetical protein
MGWGGHFLLAAGFATGFRCGVHFGALGRGAPSWVPRDGNFPDAVSSRDASFALLAPNLSPDTVFDAILCGIFGATLV